MLKVILLITSISTITSLPNVKSSILELSIFNSKPEFFYLKSQNCSYRVSTFKNKISRYFEMKKSTWTIQVELLQNCTFKSHNCKHRYFVLLNFNFSIWNLVAITKFQLLEIKIWDPFHWNFDYLNLKPQDCSHDVSTFNSKFLKFFGRKTQLLAGSIKKI